MATANRTPCKLLESTRNQAARLLSDFGLTPKGRQGIDVYPARSANPFSNNGKPVGLDNVSRAQATLTMTIPDPPDHVWEDARPTWYRIIDRLQRRGQWEPVYEMMTALTAIQCALYVRLSQVPELAEQCECARKLARELLCQMAYLSQERIPLALLDAHGRDVDLMEICRPPVNREADTMRSL